MTPTTAKPFNQRIRIWGLRLLFVLALPLILFTRPGWTGPWAGGLFELAGIFLIIACVLGRFWAILYIGAMKNRTVMQDGPYSVCRHPLYLFSSLGALGFGLMLGSFILTAVLGGAVFAVLSATAAREEGFLRQRFGPAYDSYAARVPRILPAPALFQTPPTVTASLNAVRMNLADALVFLALIPLAMGLNGLKAAGLLPGIALY